MFAAMRLLLSTARGNEARRALQEQRDFDPIPLTSHQVFGFATIEGARACGFAKQGGTLFPGKDADIVLLSTRDVNMMPLNYSYGNIVESAHPGNVDSVFVAGRAVKRNGKLVDVDLDMLGRRVNGCERRSIRACRPLLREALDARSAEEAIAEALAFGGRKQPGRYASAAHDVMRERSALMAKRREFRTSASRALRAQPSRAPCRSTERMIAAR